MASMRRLQMCTDRFSAMSRSGEDMFSKGNSPMSDIQNIKAKQALEALEQAYAYFTPEPRPEFKSPAYDEMPVAA